MGIDVHLQNESGADLRSYFDSQMLLPTMLDAFDTSKTTCLRFIDPYGDTTFNREQVEVLLIELSQLRDRLDTKTREFVDSIIELGEEVQSGNHLYLKFIGD